MNDERYLTIRVKEDTYSKLKVISTITKMPLTTLFASMIDTPIFRECLNAIYLQVLKESENLNNDTNNDK